MKGSTKGKKKVTTWNKPWNNQIRLCRSRLYLL